MITLEAFATRFPFFRNGKYGVVVMSEGFHESSLFAKRSIVGGYLDGEQERSDDGLWENKFPRFTMPLMFLLNKKQLWDYITRSFWSPCGHYLGTSHYPSFFRVLSFQNDNNIFKFYYVRDTVLSWDGRHCWTVRCVCSSRYCPWFLRSSTSRLQGFHLLDKKARSLVKV